MAIYTRFGSEMKIVAHEGYFKAATDVDFGLCVKIQHNLGDFSMRRTCDLKADNGLREIAEAVFASPELEQDYFTS